MSDVSTRKRAYGGRLDRWTAGFPAVAPSFFKYQLITVPVMGLLVLAFTGVSQLLVGARGAVTNATMLSFFLSWKGVLFAACLLVLMVAAMALELFGFVSISARALHGEKEASYSALIRSSAGKLPLLLSWGTVLLVINSALVPIVVGGDSDLSFLRGFKIPNFITSTITATPQLLSLYLGVSLVLAVLSVSLSFAVPFIVIADMKAGRAVLSSIRLVWTHPMALVRAFGRVLVLSIPVGVVAAGWSAAVMAVLSSADLASLAVKIGLFVALLIQYVVVGLVVMLTVPFLTHQLTDAFYISVARHPAFQELAFRVPQIPSKSRRSLLDRVLARRRTLVVAAVAASMLLATVMASVYADALEPHKVKVVAHRAGGSSAPENSMSGLKNSIKLGADMVEVDVQRTADDQYILNHDDTFARAAGVNLTSQQMTLAEATKLDISAQHDGSDFVPSLREFLVAAKGRIGVVIELKGATADRRMGDDVVRLVRELRMTDEVIVMSLDYDLIAYVDATYPDVPTGFCYFLSIGDVATLAGDYIIVEEGEATPDRIATLNDAGKPPIVWTVNTPEAMSKFALLPIHAVITDEAADMEAIQRQTQANWGAAEFYDLFFGSGA